MKKKTSLENTLAIHDICASVISKGFKPLIISSIISGPKKIESLSGIMTALDDHFPKFNLFFEGYNGSKAQLSFDIETDSLMMATFDKKLMPSQFKQVDACK